MCIVFLRLLACRRRVCHTMARPHPVLWRREGSRGQHVGLGLRRLPSGAGERQVGPRRARAGVGMSSGSSAMAPARAARSASPKTSRRGDDRRGALAAVLLDRGVTGGQGRRRPGAPRRAGSSERSPTRGDDHHREGEGPASYARGEAGLVSLLKRVLPGAECNWRRWGRIAPALRRFATCARLSASLKKGGGRPLTNS